MGKIEREKRTVRRMIELYCRHRLKQKTVPGYYQQLADYACHRLDRCHWGASKPPCHYCSTHCYAPAQQHDIQEVMRWVGPRMIRYAPLEAVRYLLRK